MAFDTIIFNGTVVDGTGGPRFKADVGITRGRIEAVGALGDAEAASRIDARGHVVTPGFIDMHSHSDVTLLEDPGAESKAYQGVTTEVTGNCSYSPFPAGPAGPKALRDALGGTLISRMDWDWSTMDGWASLIESNGVSINVAAQVGNGALRVAVGATEQRPATKDELRGMKRLVAEAMEQGAFSLSTGLSLSPSGYATTDEIVALCEAIAPYEGAFYVTHARVVAGWHIKAIEEAAEIGRRANIPVQYSHISITDKRHYGQGQDKVGVIEKAREEGVDIVFDMYPYTAAGGGLHELVPLWVQDGGIDDFMERLRDPETRGRARDEMAQGRASGFPPLWDTWVISSVRSERNGDLVGRSLAEIAESRGVEPAEAALQLIDEEEDAVSAVIHNRIESDVRFFMAHPLAMFGSDGRAISPNGLYAESQPHPRFYGTYPRVLGRYVREKPAVMSLETAIYKMAGFPAERLGLRDRGRIAQGLAADLVVFDADSVIDRATFEEPHQYPDGIPHVLVNGEPVIADGKHTGAMPGRVLRRGA